MQYVGANIHSQKPFFMFMTPDHSNDFGVALWLPMGCLFQITSDKIWCALESIIGVLLEPPEAVEAVLRFSVRRRISPRPVEPRLSGAQATSREGSPAGEPSLVLHLRPLLLTKACILPVVNGAKDCADVIRWSSLIIWSGDVYGGARPHRPGHPHPLPVPGGRRQCGVTVIVARGVIVRGIIGGTSLVGVVGWKKVLKKQDGDNWATFNQEKERE